MFTVPPVVPAGLSAGCGSEPVPLGVSPVQTAFDPSQYVEVVTPLGLEEGELLSFQPVPPSLFETQKPLGSNNFNGLFQT